MITYLKLAVVLAVFGVALIAASVQADSKAGHEGKIKVSKAHSIKPQANSGVSIAGETSRDRVLQALVRYEELMAERSAEQEAEKALLEAEQKAKSIINQGVEVASEKENPVIVSTTPVEPPVVADPSVAF